MAKVRWASSLVLSNALARTRWTAVGLERLRRGLPGGSRIVGLERQLQRRVPARVPEALRRKLRSVRGLERRLDVAKGDHVETAEGVRDRFDTEVLDRDLQYGALSRLHPEDLDGFLRPGLEKL